MTCTAFPGYFCPPLMDRPAICPENYYCPGGLLMAKKCLDDRWSAVGSMYPEDCQEHMNVGLAVVFVLFFMFLVLGVCIWLMSSGWSDKIYTSLPLYEIPFESARPTRSETCNLIRPIYCPNGPNFNPHY